VTYLAKRVDDAFLEELFPRFYPSAKVASMKAWIRDVHAIDVELHPGGRAVLRKPDTDYVVTIHWLPGPRVGQYEIRRCAVEPAEGERVPWDEISLGLFFAALHVARWRRWREEGTEIDEVIQRPQPGQPPSIPFYRQLLRDREVLIQDAEPGVNQVLADRYGVPLGTLKSWLSRARAYVPVD